MLKPYRCSHCSQRIVVLETRTGSYLPIDISEGPIIIEDEEFDGTKHISHLKTCPEKKKLVEEWDKKKQKFIERNNPFAFLAAKVLNK